MLSTKLCGRTVDQASTRDASCGGIYTDDTLDKCKRFSHLWQCGWPHGLGAHRRSRLSDASVNCSSMRCFPRDRTILSRPRQRQSLPQSTSVGSCMICNTDSARLWVLINVSSSHLEARWPDWRLEKKQCQPDLRSDLADLHDLPVLLSIIQVGLPCNLVVSCEH